MGIEHAVLIEQNEVVMEEKVLEVVDGIAALKDQVPGVLDVKIGV